MVLPSSLSKSAPAPSAPSPKHLRRLGLLFWGAALFGVVLILRLVQLQVWAGQSYVERAKDQHTKSVVLEAKRGRIFDRHGREVATNLKMISYFVTNQAEVKNPKAAARTLARAANLDESDLYRGLTGQRRFAWLARKFDIERLQKAEMKTLQGTHALVEMKRYYPMGSVGSQILGYTDIDNVGIEGGELGLDSHLRGQSGVMVSEVDALGRSLAERGEILTPPEDGADVTLTIDADCQWIAEEELAATVDKYRAKAGVAVLMNPRTGEILAMAGAPLYDPNRPGEHHPENRRNRAITDMYEPGSTFKIVAAAAALNEGTRRPEDQIFCENGRMAVPGGFIRDSHPLGWLSFKQVIGHSSNIGTIKVARTLGGKRLYEYARRFGFDARTGIELPGEARGLLHHPSVWSKRSMETIAIGQEVLVTPLQLAFAYGAVANEGVLMKPRILKAIARTGQAPAETRPEAIRRVIEEKACQTLVDFFKGVVKEGTGTNGAVAGYEVAGKTGTAQRAAEGGRGYESGQYVSSFVGFLPADDPRLLCLVAIDRPTGVHWGSAVAAPTFRRILERVLALRDCPARLSPVGTPPDTGAVYAGPPTMPNLLGLSRGSAEGVLRRYQMVAGFEGEGVITEQSILPGEPLGSNVRLTLKCQALMMARNDAGTAVPDLTGLPLRQAINRLSAQGLRPSIYGNGFVAAQAPAPGSLVRHGSACALVCKPEFLPVEHPSPYVAQAPGQEKKDRSLNPLVALASWRPKGAGVGN
ncbi:MAG: PASTA domain-containing protein [Candidatus Latescibacteria bacterium]|nr:PASTA domain-containing protein [Candidatus Latescibacterota bacterium]